MKRKIFGHPTKKAYLAAKIEAARGLKEKVKRIKVMTWHKDIRQDGRVEWICQHGVGHGNHVHGCEGCCTRKDYPGR